MSSSDLFLFDDSFFRHSSPDHFNLQFPFSDNFLLPFEEDSSTSPMDHPHSFMNQQLPTDPSPIVSSDNHFSSSSPPIKLIKQHLSTLGNQSTVDHQSLPLPRPTSEFSGHGVSDLRALVKPENTNSYNILNSDEKILQRSFSSHSLDLKPTGFLVQPQFNSLMEVPNLSAQATSVGSPENNCGLAMRRVYSTGDLQSLNRTNSSQGFSSSAQIAIIEEGSFRARPYNTEERKQRIHRYRSKRNQRNYNKTIKYACRKTLADSRPRIRGRFARNDEIEEIPKVAGGGFNQQDDEAAEDDQLLWLDHHVHGLYEHEGGGVTTDQGEGFQSFVVDPTNYQHFGSSGGGCQFSWNAFNSSSTTRGF